MHPAPSSTDHTTFNEFSQRKLTMKTFKELINEINYGKHDEFDADSKLLFMAMKHHLRDRRKFEDMLRNPTIIPVKAMGQSKPGYALRHYVKVSDMEMHPDLKEKYKDLHLFVGPKILGRGYGTTKGSASVKTEAGKKTVFMGFQSFKSLDTKAQQTDSLEKTYKKFHKEFNGPGQFEIWHHEMTHAHDLNKGIDFSQEAKSSKFYTDPAQRYVNFPFENRAFAKQLDYKLERESRLNPHWFSGHHDPIDKESREYRYFTNPAYRNKLSDDEFKVYRSLKQLSSRGGTLPPPKSAASMKEHDWHGMYIASSPEHRRNFEKIIGKYIK